MQASACVSVYVVFVIEVVRCLVARLLLSTEFDSYVFYCAYYWGLFFFFIIIIFFM